VGLTKVLGNVADTIRHDDHRWMYDYWDGRRRGGLLPGRGDIDPLDFPRLLPRIALIDVIQEAPAPHFRYRLAGTEITIHAARDPTGKRFDALYEGDYLTTALKTYRDILDAGTPHLSERVFPMFEGREFLRYDRLILPLARDGREIDMLLLLIVILQHPKSTAWRR